MPIRILRTARIATIVFGVAALAMTALAGNASAISPGVAQATASTANSAPGIHQHKTVRLCTAPKTGQAACNAIKQTDTVEPHALAAAAVTPNATPSGYGPTDLRSAYKLTAAGSAASTVAIVDAYDDPNAESDLAAYRTQFGLPACTTANGCFKKVNGNGATSPLPTGNTGWAGEISLDIQMVSAICPNCHILLVEAASSSNTNLYKAEDTAYASGAKFISNSWGGSESSSETSSDTHFNHPGVAITVSTGDNGYGTEYPATSQYVTAVGGTSLTTSTNARGWSETAWSGAGSGCSGDETKPTAQAGVTTGCTRRAVADVSAVADPNTGVAVYQTYGGSGWTVYGGTSVAAPIIASVYALAGAPGASDLAGKYPYAHPASLWDVTSGTNGTCTTAVLCTAGAGWDGPTGLGTPNGTAAFASGGTTTPTVTVTNPGSQSATVGTSYALTLGASGGTTYTWSATGLPGGLAISAAGVVSGTPTAAGTFSVTATASSGGSSGSATFTITVASAGGPGCTSTQLLGNAGFETGSASPWTSSAGVVNPTSAGETAHAGTYYAWLDGYGTTHTDTLAQSVTIPAGCSNTSFSFWLKIDTAETGSTAADVLTVKVGSTVLATYSNLNHAAYTQKSFNVGAFAGQTISVSFSGTENASRQTSFVIDDAAVTTS